MRAAARAVRKLGARKIATREVPVVWDPRMTAALAGIVSNAASGEALFKRSTFLAESEGVAIATARLLPKLFVGNYIQRICNQYSHHASVAVKVKKVTKKDTD